jgi:uncharacterized delta-60 repeat protein/uncharacterized repeat protein (TIGR02543 family)
VTVRSNTGTLAKPGYTFGGWCTTQPAAGSSCTGTPLAEASSFTITNNTTLYAVWTALTYSVTYYDTNSGSGAGGDGGTAPLAQTGSGVASITLRANTLSLAGYSFSGWATSDGSTTVSYLNSASVSITSNTTLNLYPVWGAPTFSSEIGTAGSGPVQVDASGIQSDGQIVVVGSFTAWNGTATNRVLRLASTGARNASFTTALGIGASAQQSRILIQSDDKIVIAGTLGTWSGSTSSYRIVRLNSDGLLDSSFITNIGVGPNDDIFALAQQSDGKLLLGGRFTSWNGTATGGIVRLNTDGTLDTTFMTNVGTGSTPITSLGLQSTGKIIVTGEFTSWNATTGMNRIVRLNSDGTRDTSFNVGTALNSAVYNARVQPDDKIVLAGNFGTFNGVIANKVTRLNSDGTLDTAFATKIGTGPGAYASRLALQSDGKILVATATTTWAGTTVGSLVRLNADGSRDTAFGAEIGTALTASQVLSLTVQPDGKIIVVGSFKAWKGSTVGGIVRLNTDGTRD